MNLDQQRRYARQIMLADVGEDGQQRLLDARVLVIGAGGLGSALISYLAAAGVGTIGIIDDDRVELSNLARQIIHETGDIGRLKVESARDRITEINPDVKVVTYPVAMTETNAMEIINGTSSATANSPSRGELPPTSALGALANYDIVADGCDNFTTRFSVNQACLAQRIPLVSAAIAGWYGQVMSVAPHLVPGTGCYQCYVHPDAPEANTCRESGVIGPLAGIIGAMQALEVVHHLLGRPALIGKLAYYDARTMQQRLVHTARDADCRVCGKLI